MTQIGTIEYQAKVSNVAEAQKNAQDFAESNREMGTSANEAATSSAFLGGVLSTTAEAEQDAAEEAEQTDERFTLLGSTVLGLAGSLGSLALKFLGISSVTGTVIGGLSSLYGWLSGLTLSGILGSVTGAISSFVSWLAAGSAGALAVGAAIGAVIGLFGVWILEITGVLDWIGKLGEKLSSGLPAWARDGIQAAIAVMTGPLAAIGAFIVGTIRGGFDQGFAMAKRVVMIQAGAIRRTIDRMAGFVARKANAAGRWLGEGFRRAKNTVLGYIQDIREWIDNLIGRIKDIPREAQAAASNVRVGGVGVAEPGSGAASEGAVGVSGFPVDVPYLNSGGSIRETGAAVVHKGETVLPPNTTIAAGGGGGVTVETMNIELSGDFDPSNVSRSDIRDLADRLVDAIGDKTNRRSGVR